MQFNCHMQACKCMYSIIAKSNKAMTTMLNVVSISVSSGGNTIIIGFLCSCLSECLSIASDWIIQVEFSLDLLRQYLQCSTKKRKSSFYVISLLILLASVCDF